MNALRNSLGFHGLLTAVLACGVMATTTSDARADATGSASGKADVTSTDIAISLDMNGWSTAQSLRVVAGLTNKATGVGAELGEGQCTLAAPHATVTKGRGERVQSDVKSGACTWSVPINNVSPGQYDVWFIVMRGSDPWGTYYAHFTKAIAPRPDALIVSRPQVVAFSNKVDAFRNGLEPDEKRLLDGIMSRSAVRPTDDASQGGTRTPLFERPDANADWIAGGIRSALGMNHHPQRPIGGTKAIGPKQDDPGPPPSPDSIARLASKLLAFSGQQAKEERAMLGWAFLRATDAGPTTSVRLESVSGVAATRAGLLSSALRLDQLGGARWDVKPSDAVGVWYPITPAPANAAPVAGVTAAPGGLPR